jgi:hypothetical protein
VTNFLVVLTTVLTLVYLWSIKTNRYIVGEFVGKPLYVLLIITSLVCVTQLWSFLAAVILIAVVHLAIGIWAVFF